MYSQFMMHGQKNIELWKITVYGYHSLNTKTFSYATLCKRLQQLKERHFNSNNILLCWNTISAFFRK